MRKSSLPVYSICSLADQPASSHAIIADHFAHYLAQHSDLRFPHKHSFYHFVYFSQGEGEHSIDFIKFPVKPGQIYFMIPGQVHTWNFQSPPDGYIVNFPLEYIQHSLANTGYLDQFPFFSGTAGEQVIDVPADAQADLTNLLETIVQENKGSLDLKDELIRAMLVQLFIRISRFEHKEHTKNPGKYNSILLRNFQKLINQHYNEKKLTSDYAAMLYVTPNHLNALTKDATGHTAGELIRDRVILEAKRLLVNDSLTIAEIALELDFMDNSYFSKFFKKNAGVTPEVFRKQLKEKR